MSNGDNGYVGMVHPGHRARVVDRLLKGLFLILLTMIGFVSGLPLVHVTAGPANDQTGSTIVGSNAGYNGTVPIRALGADPVPNLSLPKTIVSDVNDLVGAGGVISSSSQNLTLYNSAIRMRLLGTPNPHDVLLDRGSRTVSSYSFWSVQLWLNGSWESLVPFSNNFTLLGTNKTGTFVARTMQVSNTGHSGVLSIVYKATSAGPLKWDLAFTPNLAGQYRLLHLWENVTDYQMLSSSKQFRASLSGASYTLAWDDIPASYSVQSNVTSGQFSLSVNLGSLAAGSKVLVDPNIVSQSTSLYATAWSFQRKVFFEPKGGYYFVFYYNGSTISYRYSHDGLSWSLDQPMPAGWPTYVDNATSSLAAFSSNQQLIIATGGKNTTTSSASVLLRYSIGTIAGHTITWGSVQPAVNITRSATPGSTITIGIRLVNVVVSSNGMPAFSYNWYTNGLGTGVCTQSGGGISSEVGVFVTYNAHTDMSWCYSNVAGSDSQQDRSVIVPYDSNGRVRVVYQWHVGTSIELYSEWVDPNGSKGGLEIVDGSSVKDTDDLTAVADANFGTNLVYRNAADNNITYAYRSTTSSGWAYSKNILYAGLDTWPTLTLDYSTNDLYLFGADTPNGRVIMIIKTPSGSWQDSLFSYPVAGLPSNALAYLGSNLVSASATNSTSIALVWTQLMGNVFRVGFASIPIPNVWSPYSSPSDPWDGNGLAPYDQYFSNMGEYVSPSSGMLTVRQTDLAITGRGLDLAFTRVYTEPYRFLNGSPYGYEYYPWAAIGNGWQLNFPWMENVAAASYVHLWDGEGYRIPSGFWTGTGSTFENHQGENFRMIRNSTGVFLYDKSGIAYLFDHSGLNRLTKIIDSLGNNVTFSYGTNSQISKITDTVGRVFQFCYSNELLHSINQTTGTCTSSGSVRGLVFGYNSYNDLMNVTDPAGRHTSYSYDSSHWLITKITYPTTWYDTYSYTSFLSGTQAYIYRINWQRVNATQGTPVRSFQYTYTPGAGDQVSNSTVATYDRGGSQAVSYTSYSFSFTGVAWNITDSNHSLVRGELQRFNVHGQIPSDTIIVTDRSNTGWPPGSYTNYYSYDLWGNLIYSRNTIFPQPIYSYDPGPWYHESFNTYYNNGLPPSFNAFQDSFSTDQETASDNSWNVTNGYWIVNNGEYNGTETGGRQESTFASASIGKADLSLQAKIFIGHPINASDQRVGILVHHSTSAYKWMLVLHNATAGQYYLQLTDEFYGGWPSLTDPGSYSCPIVYNTWWTFNMTVHGLNVNGWATYPGQATPCTVSRTFSSSSPAISGTGFGLYAGGFSALFDNVTVTTVSGFITGTSFSNSFIRNTAPNSDIHSTLAGTAQLQNGTATIPIESYYSYYPWGGLNQTRSGHGFPDIVDDIFTPVSWTYWSFGGSSQYNAYAQPFSSGPTLAYLYRASFILYTTSGNPSGPLYAELWSNANGPGTMLAKSNPIDASRLTTTPASYSFAFPEPLNTLAGGTSYYVVVDGAGLSPSSGSIGVQVDTSQGTRGNVYLRPTNSGWSSLYTQRATLTFSVITQSWLSTLRTYDSYGNLVTFTDATGNSTSYSYSVKYQSAYLTSQARTDVSSGHLIVSSYGYNFTTGLMAWSQKPDGYGTGNFNTTYSYDILGRTTRIVYPTGDYIAYSYNDRLDYVDVTNEDGTHSRQFYDGLGRLSVSERFLSSSTYNETYTYNWQDKTVSRTDVLGHLYTYQYDPLGRLTQTTEPNGNFTQILYNDVRGWVRHIDENNLGPASWTLYTYDRMGRLIETDDPPTLTSGVNSALYYYDEVGNLRRVCFVSSQFICGQTGSQPTLYTYDNTNRLAEAQYPDNTTELYMYDNNGNVIEKTDRKSVQAVLSYDSLNRAIEVFYPGPVDGFSYSYDNNGNLLSMTGSNASIYYSYDSRNRIVQEKYSTIVSPNTSTYNVNFTYRGETLSQVSYPDGLKVSYSYDALDRVTSVFKSGSSSNYALFYYYPTDRIKSITYGNNLYANYTYDSLSRPSKITVTKPGSHGTNTTLLSLTYSYNKTGTVISVNGEVNGVTSNEQYKYDNLQRLTNATLTKGTAQTTLSYQYDTLGNRLWQKQNGTLTNYSYNSNNNELKSSTSSTTLTFYSYDANGDLFTKNVTNSGIVHWTYTWDPAGRLVKVSNDNGVQGAYSYDADGRLVGSKEGTTTSFYAYLGTETLYQSIVGSSSTDYIFAGGTRIVKVTGTTVSYYHADTEGNTRLVTSSTGSVLFADNYLPFGQDNGTSTGSETYKFIGKPWSSTIGLYYDYQRWYDPTMGRFISMDGGSAQLLEPQSVNKYIYALDNPLGYIDPDGASPISTLLKAFGGLSVFAYSTVRFLNGDFSPPILPFNGHFKINPINMYNGDIHVVWEGYRDLADGGKVMSKFDRPSESQPFYHFRVDLFDRQFHAEAPEQIGGFSTGMLDAFFDHPAAFGGVLTGIGAAISVYNVVSAYQQGERQGDIALTREAFSWGGAIGGAEIGAAIGTMIFPGVGTVIGGLIGGGVGAYYGGNFGDWVGNQLFDGPFPGYIYYATPAYGKDRANPT